MSEREAVTNNDQAQPATEEKESSWADIAYSALVGGATGIGIGAGAAAARGATELTQEASKASNTVEAAAAGAIAGATLGFGAVAGKASEALRGATTTGKQTAELGAAAAEAAIAGAVGGAATLAGEAVKQGAKDAAKEAAKPAKQSNTDIVIDFATGVVGGVVGGIGGALGSMAAREAAKSSYGKQAIEAAKDAIEAGIRGAGRTTLPDIEFPKAQQKTLDGKINPPKPIEQLPELKLKLEPYKFDKEKFMKDIEASRPKTAFWMEERQILKDPFDNLKLNAEDQAKFNSLRNSKAAWTPEMSKQYMDLIKKGLDIQKPGDKK